MNNKVLPIIIIQLICAACIAFTLSINAAITDYMYIRSINFLSLLCLFYIYPIKTILKNNKNNLK